MTSRRIKMVAASMATLGLVATTPAPAYMALPSILVGPPTLSDGQYCRLSMTRPGGSGSGAAIPFRSLMLGAPVNRTTTSFVTGGGGTSNAMIEAQRRAAGLPYAPPTVDPLSAALPATFAVVRGGPMTAAPYQRMPLTSSKGIAEPYGLIYSQAVSATRGQIVSLMLTIAGRPTAPPRLRLAVLGSPERGCRQQTIQVYAPAMSAATVARLFTQVKGACGWHNLAKCTRAQWPRGRVLFVSSIYGKLFDYRWVDYDLLAG